MNNIIVYCEIENGKIADVSLELLSKGRSIAQSLQCRLEALLIGANLKGLEGDIFNYGAETLYIADDPRLERYSTLPYSAITSSLFREELPQIALFGATNIGRDLAPRVSSALHSGLTADCTSLEIGNHTDLRSGTTYQNLLYQIRPAFGGNIIATIINPDHRPQMATVREGVMKKEPVLHPIQGKVHRIDAHTILTSEHFVVSILERHIEEYRVNIKDASMIVAGGYGVGSREKFDLLFGLAKVFGGQVGASRAAVDAGFAHHERQVGQTGVTVRPKLYIACGISGQIQHTTGMDQSAKIISINTDPNAPINRIADWVITGDVSEVIPRMIQAYKKNAK